MAKVRGALRRLIQSRANWTCEYCRLDEAHGAGPAWYNAEHIRPQSDFAEDEKYLANGDTNLAWSCPRCNQVKGSHRAGIDPQDGRQYVLFNPRLDVWHDHFVALPSGRIEGKAAIGRATVARLGFNDYPLAVQHRAWLYALGVWPA